MLTMPESSNQPSEVAQILPWNMFDFPLQMGEFASATREMAQTPGLIGASSQGWWGISQLCGRPARIAPAVRDKVVPCPTPNARLCLTHIGLIICSDVTAKLADLFTLGEINL
jgi:hypothetical protein